MIVELPDVPRIPKRISPDAAQVDGQRHAVGWTLFLVLAVLLTASASANAQSVPEPPTLCAEEDGDCGADGGDTGSGGDSTSSVGKRWNPGHYLKTQGNHAQSDIEDYLVSIDNQLAKVNDSPEIRGAQVAYAWGVVEPSLGNYNWEPIYRHLDYLSARGKKMILSVHTKCFGTDCANLAPSNLSGEVFLTPNGRTQTTELWEDANMDHYITLMQAVAAEFDDNPALEIILGAESTPSLRGASPPGYTREIYAAQLKRMYSAQAEAFKKTNVIANVNYLSEQVAGLIEHAYKEGVGRGMPDIFDSDGSLIFRGECEDKECGIRDYRGLLPHYGIASHQSLEGKFGTETDTPAETIAYGLDNKITHYAWVSAEPGEDSWEEIVSAIESTSPDAHTACPTVYTSCN
jgi:hypothetical protein